MDLNGWHPDPFGTHEERFIKEGEPTSLVRDDGIGSYDEPPQPLMASSSQANPRRKDPNERVGASNTDALDRNSAPVHPESSRTFPDRAPLAGRSSLQNPVANPFAAPKGPERTVLSASIAAALGWLVWLILFAEWFSVPSLTPQGPQVGSSPIANAASAIGDAYGSAASGLLPNPHTALIVVAIIMVVCLVVFAVYFKQVRISIGRHWQRKELKRSRLKPLAWLSAAAIVGSLITIIAGVVPVNQLITGIYHAAKGCSRAGVSVGSCLSYKTIVVAVVGVLALVGSAIALVASLFCLAYVRTAARYVEP